MPDEIDAAEVYAQTKQRFAGTVATLSGEQLTTYVPAAPKWRVRDVLAHVIGLAADLNAQRFPAADDIGGSAWAAQQVASRRDVPIAALLAEWDREAPTFEEGLRVFGYAEGCHFVADLHAHHQDVRGALGLARDDHRPTVQVALDHYLGFLGELLAQQQWGTLSVVTDVVRHVGGDGPHLASVTASPFEVLRAFSARRSAAQIRRLRWSGDSEALLQVLQRGFTGGYAVPVDDVLE